MRANNPFAPATAAAGAVVAVLLLLLQLSTVVQTVDRNNFKSCDESSFCRRCRKVPQGATPFAVVPNTLNTYSDSVTVDLLNAENGQLFVLKLAALKTNTFHVVVEEKEPLIPRFRATDALKGPLEPDTLKVTMKSDEQIIVTSGRNQAVIVAKPFRIDVFQNDVLTVVVNARGLMRFEHTRTRPNPANDDGGNEIPDETVDGAQKADPAAVKSIEDADPGSWEENYKSHHDSKPNGPQAIALDFAFPAAKALFGIPEHADTFVLKSTIEREPYRLYNLDVFEYEIENGMALYGSVPVLYGHGPERTAGVYWQNAAETWVDIYRPDDDLTVLSSLVNMVAGAVKVQPPLTAHFMSETGVVDAFVLLGPRPNDAFKQYTDLTGVAPLPQMFALGYHQCRWNYNDQADVTSVSQNFDVHDIPMDTMWLDIEYTDAKKYFTWDAHKFPDSLQMIRNLTALGRHLTVIIDPHIKRDGNYFFHNTCVDRGYYTKNKDGSVYEGWCWPGAASYPDLFNPEVRRYFGEQYAVENFEGTTTDVMIWNDMNEPSVFNGPEVTMPKDVRHFGGWEHRDVHNLYGHMQLVSTYAGLGERSGWQQRPFILSRAHFAGSQRYATIWTGDNAATWGHLQASIKMCLAEAVAGFSFCGADIGGFFGNPEEELLRRWYQAAAYQPFFRAHAHIDTRRREPWLFPNSVHVFRDAIRRRYALLPLWYTLFYEHERFGLPVMRPLLAHYPGDVQTYGVDTEYLIGDVLLVAPVMKEQLNGQQVYFPETSPGVADVWYDVDDQRRIEVPGWQVVPVDAMKVPVYQRGGTILVRKERIRRAATLMASDPYTLVVCVDREAKATGTLYADDEKTFAYRDGKYTYLRLAFADGVLMAESVDKEAVGVAESWVERVRFVGLERVPRSATIRLAGEKDADGTELEVSTENGGRVVVVRKPAVSVQQEAWTITLNY